MFLPFWIWLAQRFGKLPIWIVCGFIGTFGGGALFFCGEGDVLANNVILFVTGAQFGAFLFLGPAMVADIIDYDELHTGKRREAQFGSFMAIVPKFIAIPGGAIPLAILANAGYVANQAQSMEVQMVIRSLYALFPAVFDLIATLVIWKYPLNEKVHKAIRQGISQHERGEAATDPLTGKSIPPMADSEVDEDTGWFLDNFSRGELGRFLLHGSSALRRGVAQAVVLSACVCAGAVWVAFSTATDLAGEPSWRTIVAVVVAGFALAVVVFHLIRIQAARRMGTRPIKEDVVRAHLQALKPSIRA